LITILGAYWFVSGLFALISLVVYRTDAGYKILFGILGIVAGLAILFYPIYGTVIVVSLFVIFIGVWGLLMGFIALFAAFKGGGWGTGIIGILLIIFGCLLLANVFISAAMLPFILGVFGIIGGLAAIIGSFMLKGHTA
jgi:uncharacterized membrane protein HdeD (DUF308 family)